MHRSWSGIRILVLLLIGCVTSAGTTAEATCRIQPSCINYYGCAFFAAGPFSYAGSGVTIRNLMLFNSVPCNSMLGFGEGDQAFQALFDLDYSTDGVYWTHANGVANGTTHVGPQIPEFEVTVNDTELLQLDIFAGTLPSTLRLRESPTLASAGNRREYISFAPDGSFLVTSFFDVFTELSLDGGQTWSAASQPIHLAFDEVRPTPTMSSTWGALKLLYR